MPDTPQKTPNLWLVSKSNMFAQATTKTDKCFLRCHRSIGILIPQSRQSIQNGIITVWGGRHGTIIIKYSLAGEVKVQTTLDVTVLPDSVFSQVRP